MGASLGRLRQDIQSTSEVHLTFVGSNLLHHLATLVTSLRTVCRVVERVPSTVSLLKVFVSSCPVVSSRWSPRMAGPVPVPVFVVDARRVVLFFNQGCEQLTGWAASDLIGRSASGEATGTPRNLQHCSRPLCPPSEPQATTHRVHLLTRSGQSPDVLSASSPCLPSAPAERGG